MGRAQISILSLFVLTVTALQSCREDHYQPNIFGTYDLTVEDSGGAETSSSGGWGSWDTTYARTGTIVKYKDEYGQQDLYLLDDDLSEDPTNKITVFVENEVLINAQVAEDGSLVKRSTWDNPGIWSYYGYDGKFYGTDSVLILYRIDQGFENTFYRIRGRKK